MTKKHAKFKRSKYSAEFYNFIHYMDIFYMEKSKQSLIDAIRALNLVPIAMNINSRAIYNFTKTAYKFCRRMDAANNLGVGEFFASLDIYP